MQRESPEQLALPLFEPEAVKDPRQNSTKSAVQPTVRPGVASGRALSQPARASITPTLLTTQEAAALLHVHPRTVQRLVARGELEAVHLGAAVRFDPADLASLTDRLKHRAAGTTTSYTDSVRPGHRVRVSFADRLRSQNDEHRAA